MSAFERRIHQLVSRVNMMLARGVLRAVRDADGIQRMQVSLFAGETADDVQRLQTYGLSTVPPAGGDALIAFPSGNRDDGIVIAVNDRGSRPRDLHSGEVELYNDKRVSILLTNEGDLKIRARRIEIEADEQVLIRAPAVDINP